MHCFVFFTIHLGSRATVAAFFFLVFSQHIFYKNLTELLQKQSKTTKAETEHAIQHDLFKELALYNLQ